MNWVKGFAVATCLAASLSAIEATTAAAAETKPTEAMLSKCSSEADAKGLFVKKGKAEERKAFRKTCVRKAMGLEK